MKNWINKNLKSIIVTAFVIPILLVAFVSISHVTTFYGISNPISWSIYLSVAIEIAALSALAGVSVKLGKFIYFPFILVTLIQFVGNLFFSFSFINETSETFIQWMEMSGPLFEPIGVESTDIPTHKLILALFSGGLLPLISLTFAHMLVVYSNRDDKTIIVPTINIDEISKIAGTIEAQEKENEVINITQETLNSLENYLDELQNNKFQNKENIENFNNPVNEEILVSPTQELEVTENEVVEELKDKLANENGIKRLTYTKQNA